MAISTQILNTKVHIGDQIKVHLRVKEGEKEKIQIFAGMVIAIKGAGINKSFTVRKIATGAIGVERIWPVSSPWLKKIEIVKRGKVRRAKLYYLRDRVGKQASRVKTDYLKEKEDKNLKKEVKEEKELKTKKDIKPEKVIKLVKSKTAKTPKK